MPVTKRQIELRRKCDAAGLFLAGGVTDLTDLAIIENITRQVLIIMADPVRSNMARERGFSIIETRKNGHRPHHPESTRLMAAAGYHILRAGLDPAACDAPTVIGAVAFTLDPIDF